MTSLDVPVEGLPGPALVVGSSGGIGRALVSAWEARGVAVHGLSRKRGLDLLSEESIAAAVEGLSIVPRLVIVATGLLHDGKTMPEKTYASLDPAWLAHNFAVNATGPALVAKHLLPRMPREGRSLFAVLSARVGSIADNRLGGWYSYRASKAALNQIVRTLAIEQTRRAPDSIVVALHPGTVATGLSAPFRRGDNASSPQQAAEHLLDVVAALDPRDSGGFFSWNGTPIPF